MNERQLHLRIGVFVITGFLAILAVLFYLGLSDIFVNKVKLFTYFSESVQGLTIGSSVKYRGVPVGSVSRLSIDMDSKKVFVIMEIEPRFFHSVKSKERSIDQFNKMLSAEVSDGLRCRLEFAGITGMKFIELDYFARNTQAAKTDPKLMPDAHYIPSVQSTIKDLSGTLSSALERLSHIHFEEIAQEMERSLGKLSEILSDPAIRSTISRINDAAENLEQSTSTVARVFDETRLNRLLNALEKDLEVVNTLAEQLTDSTRQMKLPESAEAFRKTLASLLESREDISTTLSKFNQTLESIRMLTDYLGTDPSSIIKGKQKSVEEK